MTRYEPAIDVAALTAIDMHVHIEVDGHAHASLPDDLAEAASRYFSTDGPRPDLDSIAAYYRERRMAAVVFTVDAETQLGHPPISSAEVAAGAARHPDVLIPFGSVDPRRPDAVERARRLIDESGVRGFKFHPTVQGFDPSDEAHYPLYAELEAAGVVALFHTGQTGIGAGMPGGRGLRLALSNPM
ncbi:amidohydrolase family protein, partial [Microbacterium sp. 5K110]|uniref:amidohydrolase family protein n=3 Tax=unclassified Microbacterium TaxID=2609290 RepID=UPI001280EBE6